MHQTAPIEFLEEGKMAVNSVSAPPQVTPPPKPPAQNNNANAGAVVDKSTQSAPANGNGSTGKVVNKTA
jgi:hypothetical protein